MILRNKLDTLGNIFVIKYLPQMVGMPTLFFNIFILFLQLPKIFYILHSDRLCGDNI